MTTLVQRDGQWFWLAEDGRLTTEMSAAAAADITSMLPQRVRVPYVPEEWDGTTSVVEGDPPEWRQPEERAPRLLIDDDQYIYRAATDRESAIAADGDGTVDGRRVVGPLGLWGWGIDPSKPPTPETLLVYRRRAEDARRYAKTDGSVGVASAIEVAAFRGYGYEHVWVGSGGEWGRQCGYDQHPDVHPDWYQEPALAKREPADDLRWIAENGRS